MSDVRFIELSPEEHDKLVSRSSHLPHLVAAGLAKRCEVNLAYAIGVARPVSVAVETFGTEAVPIEQIERAITETFDLRPAGN